MITRRFRFFLCSCLAGFFLFTALSVSAQKCKYGSVNVKVLSQYCYSYDSHKSKLCKKFRSMRKVYNPESFKVWYLKYKYQGSKVVGTIPVNIPNNTVTAACVEKISASNTAFLILVSQYPGGFSFTYVADIQNLSTSVVVQPVMDPQHLGSKVVFCQSSFTPGSGTAGMCPLAD